MTEAKERSMLHDKTVLITGGTGSFGRKFVEIALSRYEPRKVIVFSRDELKQHEMRSQFNNDPRLGFFIGNVRDVDRLKRAFSANVDIVLHTAALKQVPACEYNPYEAVKTNILGSQNVVEAAIDCGVPKVIALSSDKAVNPVNLYGASKLCAEKIFTQGNSYAGGKVTRFCCARYGNVVGSRGSVVPVFREQSKSGTVTVTDKRMTRFWITLEQAVKFVIVALTRMQGGEVFVPRIPSMGIMDLAEAVAPDAKIEFDAIRPGEKIHEVLVSEDESRHTIAFDDMFIIKPEYHPWGESSWEDGAPLPDGFVYASNANDQSLSVDDLRSILATQ